jgi:hypothetical protein
MTDTAVEWVEMSGEQAAALATEIAKQRITITARGMPVGEDKPFWTPTIKAENWFWAYNPAEGLDKFAQTQAADMNADVIADGVLDHAEWFGRKTVVSRKTFGDLPTPGA